MSPYLRRWGEELSGRSPTLQTAGRVPIPVAAGTGNEWTGEAVPLGLWVAQV